MFVIKRIDQDKGYVAKAGSAKSYTRGSIHKIKVYSTKEEAEDNCCGNEIVVSLENIFEIKR